MISGDEKIDLHPLTLSFRGNQACLEDPYTRSVHENSKYLFEIRIVIALAGIYYCLFGLLDMYLVPDGYKSLHLIRYGVFCPTVLFVILFSYTRHFRWMMQWALVLTGFVGGGGIIAMIVIAPAPVTHSYYAGLILVFMFLYTFGRIRFIWATLTGWTLITIYEISAVFFNPTPLPILINNNFFFIGANLIGMASSYMLEFFDRKNFFINLKYTNERKKTAKINEILEERVKERTAMLNDLNDDLLREIEQRKIIEGELKNIRDELEIRVESRTAELVSTNRALEKAKAEADASTRAKSEFLANMSHEIRTPMNAIIGMSDLAMNNGISQAQRDEYLDIIGKSARSLLGIINDILDLSKIEAGKLELEIKSFKLREYIESVTDIFIEMIHSKGIEFIVDIAPDIPVYAKGDSLRLQQVLLNLISNALKFTDKGGICVKVKKGTVTDETVELLFDVTDTGIGIDMDKNRNLFDAFSQADGSITRKYGGTGLGLTICMCIVSMMGGTIRVNSRPGLGSSFQFNIFLKRDHEKEHLALALSASKRIHEISVVSVIPNISLNIVVSQMLQLFRMRCHVSDRLDDVLDTIASGMNGKSFDVLIVDEDVVLNGSMDKLKAYKDSISLSVILLGGFKTEEELDVLRDNGIDEVVIKPVKSSNLFDAIMKTMGKGNLVRVLPDHNFNVAGSLQGMNVLLVEDNPINQMVAIELLMLEGIHVSQASNGVEAVRMISENKGYDVVLMDVQMPEMDGIEATRIIRGEMGISPAKLPVIAMTAHVMQGDRDRCIEAGMNDFISKPVERKKMFAVLGKYYQNDTPVVAAFNRERITSQIPENVPDRLPGVDIKDGLTRLGCDFNCFIDILLGFDGFFKNTLLNMKNLRQIGDKTNFLKEVHSLKGSAANISATDLYRTSKILEETVISSGILGQDNLVTDLEKAYTIFTHTCSELKESYHN